MFAAFLRRFRSAHPAPAPRSRLQLEPLEDRTVLSTVYGLLPNNTLIRFDSATPGTIQATVPITGLQASQQVVGIDFRPRTGQLYASAVADGSASGSAITTYRIDPLTGAATALPTTATAAQVADVRTGYDFNPTVDRIRFVNESNENVRLNPNNGALAGDDTNLTFTAPATGPIVAEAYDRNFDRQNNAGDMGVLPTTLFGIDAGASRLVIQGGIDGTPSPNGGAITSIGALGITLDAAADAGFDIAASTANGGLGTALASLTSGGTTRLYSLNLTSGAATLIGAIGNGGTQVISLAIVPDASLIVGSLAGAQTDVRLLDPTTGAIKLAIPPFVGFSGGIRVATGDVTRDGVPDIIVAAIFAQGHIKVFDGLTGQLLPQPLGSFFAFQGFGGTVNIGSGDVNRDGFDDVLVAANGLGANGHVKAFSGADGSLLASFLAYQGFGGNVTLSAADFNNDGTDEIVTVASSNGHVRIFNANGTDFTSAALPGFVNSFFSFAGFGGDVNVAAGDVTGDGIPDIVVGSGAGTRGHIEAFNGATNALVASFFAFEAGFSGGAFVGLANRSTSGLLTIFASAGPGRQSEVRGFISDPLTGGLIGTFPAFTGWVGGATLGGARF